MNSDELWEKFFDCGIRAIAAGDLLALFERLQRLETVADLREVTTLLTPRALQLAETG